jgi:signal transduction histidine kinase
MEHPLWWMLTLVVPGIAMVAYWLVARRQVRVAAADLRRRLDEERRITAHVSHRLRNPLTVIYGFSETLVDASLADSTEVAKVAAILNAEALDVARTVEDLVTTKEIERGDIQIRALRFDPSEEIERVVAPFQRLGSPISVEAWSGAALADPLRFRQVVQNLVSNAVRHGGPEVAVFADIAGSVYQCTVADDGPGLPVGVESQLFASSTPSAKNARSETGAVFPDDEAGGHASQLPGSGSVGFLRVDVNNLEGLGLGLGVAIAMAEGLGGEVTYERSDGVTAFTFTLPTEGWPGPLDPIHSKSGELDGPKDSYPDGKDETRGRTAITEVDAVSLSVRFDEHDTVPVAEPSGANPGVDSAEAERNEDEDGLIPSVKGTNKEVGGP